MKRLVYAVALGVLLPNAALAQSFEGCLAMGIPRHTCEDMMAATAPPGSKAYNDAMHSYIERDVHKHDPNWHVQDADHN